MARAAICVHKGFKLQAALCIDRLPTKFVEPQAVSRWRSFAYDWRARTNTELELEEPIVYMRFPFHFLPTAQEKAKALADLARSRSTDASYRGATALRLSPSESETEARTLTEKAVRSEGLDFGFEDLVEKEHVTTVGKEAEKVEVDVDARSITKVPERVLHLLIRQHSDWTLPIVDKEPGETMTEACSRAADKVGLDVHLVSSCPMLHVKRRFRRSDLGFIGTKTYFYRAHVIPTTRGALSNLKSGGEIADWAWLPHEEVGSYLAKEAFWRAGLRDCYFE